MILCRARCCHHCLRTQIEEVLQQVELALRRVALTGAVVDVDLRITHHIGMIHVEVMLRILHHGIKVVVVSHTEPYRVRISLT